MKTKSSELMNPLTADQANNNCNDVQMHDVVFSKRGCFWIPCFNARSEPMIETSGQSAKKRWWSKGWKKIRDWSEIVAGPKWKTFIRRFNKNQRGNNSTAAVRHAKFHYDPLSYSLNFDDGPGQNRNFDDDFVHRDFSARFASIPASAKSSMDLGKDYTLLS